MSKSYNELEFTDNFMFVKVLDSKPDLCRELIELILPLKIRHLEVIDYEKSLRSTYESKGIRFDIYAEGDDLSRYDIEMQANPDPSIAKRSRYYHSMMDMELLQQGKPYSDLKKSFVIFICKEKIADGYNEPIYTFRYQSQEDPAVYLNDETWTVYVNAHCNDADLSDEMKAFLKYIRTGQVEKGSSGLASRIHREVEDAKTSGKWSAEYMRWEDELNDRYRKGLEDGREEGRKEEKLNTERERLRANTAEQRAVTEARRADTEARRAKALEQRIAELENLLETKKI